MSNAPLLRLSGLTKRFGELAANDGVDLEAFAGEVHCLLGENGAGKSTLISLLAGFQQPDSGSIEIDGSPTALRSPAVARARGIGVVYQHSALVPTMSVLDNLLLGPHGFRLDRKRATRRIEDLAERLGTGIDPGRPLGELGLAQQQHLEIAKAMWAEPRILILDEPTSTLGSEEARELGQRIREFASAGGAVILVTHKLGEVFELGDRVTVLRQGRVTDHLDPAELRGTPREANRARILTAMFGAAAGGAAVQDASRDAARDSSPDAAESLRFPRPTRSPGGRSAGPPVLVVERATTRGDGGAPIEGIDLRLDAGEIIGIAGIDGHGQKHLAEAIAGQRRLAAGRVLFEGEDLAGVAVRNRQRRGVRYVTDDRLREGIVGSLSVSLNLVLKRIGERPLWRFGFEDRAAISREASALIERYGIRTPAPDTRAGLLSGGNIQKILLARELSHGPRVVVFDKPGYGLDLKTVRLVRQEIQNFVSAGGAALVISTDLEELIALADRIAVLSQGRIVGWVENDGEHHAEDEARDDGPHDGADSRVRKRIGAFMAADQTAAQAAGTALELAADSPALSNAGGDPA